MKKLSNASWYRACVLLSLFLLMEVSGCQFAQTLKLNDELRDVKRRVRIGDNIFDAKDILEDQGYSVDGPKFFTPSKSSYLMVVDFGVRPNAAQVFAYTVGIDYPWRKIRGVVEADENGTIYKIE